MSGLLGRRAYAWCTAAVACSLLPLGQTLPAWLAALDLLLIGFGAALGLSGRTLSPWLRLPLTLGVAFTVLFVYDFQFGRDTGAALLITMLALKLFETRRVRDARSVLSFSLFGVMAGFLQSQSPLTLLLALLATVLCLTALARVADAELPPGESVGREPVRRQLRASGLLMGVSLPLAIVGFFLFPRLGSPLWGMPDNTQARSGLSDEMSPGDIASLFTDDSPVLRVQFEGEAPSTSEMYWRGPVLSDFDGRTWTRSRWRARLPPAEVEPLGESLSYEVTQEPTDRRFLLALDLPEAAPDDAFLGLERSIVRSKPQTELLRFRVRSWLQYRFEPQLRRSFADWETDLPADYNPRTRAMVTQWVQQGDAPTRIVRRALDLFNAEFRYTLTPPLLGRDSVDDFVFNTRLGYCEHFASAFVVMMRFAGIPARVVTGYQGGSLNPIGDYWVVRQSDAHAWTEVWMQDRGWVRVDPTSVVAPDRIQHGAGSLLGPAGAWADFARPLLQAGDWLRRGWNDIVLGFNANRQRSLLQVFGIDRASTSQLGIALASGIGLALALTLFLLLRQARDARDPLARAYARFLQRIARAGVRKQTHEAPLAFADRVARELPAVADSVHALSRRYALRRYAPQIPDAGSDASLCDDLRDFRVPTGN